MGVNGSTPPRPPSGSHRSTRGISRRVFLKHSGTALVSGLVASRIGAVEHALAHQGEAHAEPAVPLWAATRHGGRHLALSGSAEQPAIHELAVDRHGRVTLGSSVGVSLPHGFAALALLGAGRRRLLVAGGMVEEAERLTIDYRAHDVHPDDREALPDDQPQGVQVVPVLTLRPALYEVTDGTVTELPLGHQVRVAYGAATAITATSGGHLAVLVEGSDDLEQAHNDVTRVAESGDGGRTWSARVLAAGLGEGGRSHVAAASGGRLVAVTVDGGGGRRFHERAAAAPRWRPAPATGSGGAVLALVPAGRDAVDLIERSSGQVRRRRREGAAPRWEPAGTVETGEDVLALVAVSGSRDLIAIGASGARLVS